MATKEPRIDAEPDAGRQARLEAAYQTNINNGKAPYHEVALHTYGEVSWVMRQRHWSGEPVLLDGLARPDFSGAFLNNANLSGILFIGANLAGAELGFANLSGALCGQANLHGASLSFANLSGTSLSEADLQDAKLVEADLSGAFMTQTDLSAANLRGAKMSTDTELVRVRLSSATRLGDIRWNGVSLLQVDWAQVRRGQRLLLGDETVVLNRRLAAATSPHPPTRDEWLRRIRYSARAYRGLGRELKDQNLAQEASWCRLSEQRLERRALFWQRTPGSLTAGFGSALLDLVSGYGELPARTFIAYLVVVFGFALAYLGVLHDFDVTHALDAFVYSLTSFHGRGFFPGAAVTAHDPQVLLAAFEAVVGLFIELILIATFSRRFLGNG